MTKNITPVPAVWQQKPAIFAAVKIHTTQNRFFLEAKPKSSSSEEDSNKRTMTIFIVPVDWLIMIK